MREQAHRLCGMSSATEDPSGVSGKRTPLTRQVVYDTETGESVGVLVPEDAPKARGRLKKTYGEPFASVFLALATQLGQRKDLTATDHRVLWGLIGRSSQEQVVIDSDPAGLAAELGLHVTQVVRSLATLAKADLIVRPRKGKLLVHPLLLWRGTPEDRARYLLELARSVSA